MDPARGRGDGPDDEFESIVANWRREGSVPAWPTDAPGVAENAPEGAAENAAPARDLRGPDPVEDPGAPADPDDEHYHPPEPPPLPRPGPPAVVGAALILLGLCLCVAPGVLGAGGTWPLPLGLVLIAAGLTWLVLRLWATDPDDDGPDPYDDGSRL